MGLTKLLDIMKMMKSRLTLDSTVSRAKRLFDMEVHGERVLIDTASGNYVGLDSVGSAIYDALVEPRSVQDLLAHLTSLYDDPAGAMAGDLLEFLEAEKAAHRIDVIAG